MRRIAAHIAFTGKEYIENPLIELDNEGRILSVKQCSMKERELENTTFFSGMLTPGFINAHTHLELSYPNCTYDEGKGMIDFIKHVIEKRKNNPTPDKSALTNLYRNMRALGTVACADICNSDISYSAKQDADLSFINFFEFFALSVEQAKSQGLRFEKILNEFKLLKTYPAFHSPYAMSREGLSELNPLFLQSKIGTLHFRESADELTLNNKNNPLVNFYQTLNDKFQPAFALGTWKDTQGEYLKNLESLLLVHNIFLSEQALIDVKQWGVENGINLGFVLCPRSNENIHKKLPPVDVLMKHHVNICLGTDSLLSVQTLSVFDEMKFLTEKFPKLKLSDVLKMATVNAAKVLNFKHLGEISEGMKPGINGIKMKNLKSDVLSQGAELIRLV